MDSEAVFENFGRNLKLLRKEKKLTQEDLAEVMDVSKTTIVNYENGNRRIPLDMVVKVASFFKVTVDSLLDNEVNKIINIREWNEELGDVAFTPNEMVHLIAFGKYLLYLREDPSRGENKHKK